RLEPQELGDPQVRTVGQLAPLAAEPRSPDGLSIDDPPPAAGARSLLPGPVGISRSQVPCAVNDPGPMMAWPSACPPSWAEPTGRPTPPRSWACTDPTVP